VVGLSHRRSSSGVSWSDGLVGLFHMRSSSGVSRSDGLVGLSRRRSSSCGSRSDGLVGLEAAVSERVESVTLERRDDICRSSPRVTRQL